MCRLCCTGSKMNTPDAVSISPGTLYTNSGLDCSPVGYGTPLPQFLLCNNQNAEKIINMVYNEKTELPVVSVIVITYNQDLNKLLKTLDSIVIQEGIPFEVIICDDGSEKTYEKELENYFSLKGFASYRLLFHEKNEGTVSNYYSGLEIARGEYSKLISPGDYLSERHTLERWFSFLKERNAVWAFSDVYYYDSRNEGTHYFRALATPQMIRPYLKRDQAKCAWNYVALCDLANGAAMMGKTAVQMHFCKQIQEKGILYCEDNIYRLMMYEGIVGAYFPEPAICYEYGNGVSTSGSPEWRRRMDADDEKLIRMMSDKENLTDQQKKMVKAFIRCRQAGKVHKLFIRGKLLCWIRRHFFPRLAPVPERRLGDE